MSTTNTHTAKRIEALNSWSETGVLKPREAHKSEADFTLKIKGYEGKLLHLHRMCDLADQRFRVETTHLIDAFDLFASHPDLSFEFCWRALELELWVSDCKSVGGNGRANVSKEIEALANLIPDDFAVISWQEAPLRAFEFLYNRIIPVVNSSPDGIDIDTDLANSSGIDESIWITQQRGGVANRMRILLGKETWDPFIESFSGKFAPGDMERQKQGALCLRRVLQSGIYESESQKQVFSMTARKQILISGFLYPLRNERAHGVAMSPFLSSRASIKTYALPMYATSVTYAMLSYLWCWNRRDLPLTEKDVLPGLTASIESLQDLFSRNSWKS